MTVLDEPEGRRFSTSGLGSLVVYNGRKVTLAGFLKGASLFSVNQMVTTTQKESDFQMN